MGRLKGAHRQVLHDQKQRSVKVIGRLGTSKQRMEAELDEAHKGVYDVAAQLGWMIRKLDTLCGQVTS